ncbi:serine/threonine-protein phosphatase 7 long form homolog [Arachis hypogaea]|uniref:serine/threonine-protein phosphatase 7 long form homolog n=1 Tax=Arachis hypogaea TaxID=3818 RepID=UPI003B22662A
MLTCDHPIPLDRYNDRVEEHLRFTGFYHASQIGAVESQKALVNALIERWHPNTHTFYLPIGECAVTFEDVALILGLLTDSLLVTGMTMSSFEVLEAECLHKSDCARSCIKLTWLRDLKENLHLTDENNIQRYVKCHIMLLIGTILFGDKSRAGVHWKFLPLLRDFGSIRQYSWGSACLAHLYKALCRASRFDCKEIDGPLTLLLSWAWIRLPYLSPLPKESCSFPLANRWRNWERSDRQYRYLTLAHFRKAFDELQEGQFVWVAYTVNRVDPNIISAEIYMQSVVWSATVPFVSFECIEWHATDRYNHILTELPMPSHHPLDTYMYWYRTKFGDRLNLSNLVVQENDEGNQDMDDDNEEQEPQSPPPSPPNPLPQDQPQSSSQYVP